ncbi:endonuclease/exonuclease/phosphatase family protein [Nannocystis radixulma]|uniref:Endonuclease/exonuclease/phosphatase family protein n=1 Tax=Nannocystis radixulma TaxID=2995305 RepID=A0ABT5AXZ2_9BACT|nr:endonuclease/exonuclease/phosphatase family protein [Nannocystis radixulma]MDC0666701.1 endonuclease/exonuclease/phosphatase family protein [Nannocystis radixulma]
MSARARLAALLLAACDGPAGHGHELSRPAAGASGPATTTTRGAPRLTTAATSREGPSLTTMATTATGGQPFDEFPYDPGPPDLDARLCDEAADPAGAPDKIFLHCRLEGGSFAPPAVAPRDELVVLAWNLERGLQIDGQLAALKALDELPAVDVLLLGEVDRGCSRTGGRAIAWELAEALQMNFVFGVEFTELPREGGPGGTIASTCEHGNAILSRYPLGGVELVRHAANRSWYDSAEPRLGGRMFLKADLAVGTSRLAVYSLHFESGALDGAYRTAQATELAEHGLQQPHRVVFGGDMNAALYFLDPGGDRTEETTRPLFDRGYLDAHRSLPTDQRTTHDPGLVLDLIFSSGPFTSAPGLCSFADCPDLSDHAPIWATVALDSEPP